MKFKLKNVYKEKIIPNLSKRFNVHPMAVPRLEKVVVSFSKNAKTHKEAFNASVKNLENITGRKSAMCYARKSIAQFSVRSGDMIGAKVTLRGDMMYNFVQLLTDVALLNWRAFEGLDPRSINDKSGNISYTLGIQDNRIFPVTIANAGIKDDGLQIVFCSNTKDKVLFQELLAGFDLPWMVV